MAWYGGHHVQQAMNELVARAHIDDLKRNTNRALHRTHHDDHARRRRKPNIFRRFFRRMRGG